MRTSFLAFGPFFLVLLLITVGSFIASECFRNYLWRLTSGQRACSYCKIMNSSLFFQCHENCERNKEEEKEFSNKYWKYFYWLGIASCTNFGGKKCEKPWSFYYSPESVIFLFGLSKEELWQQQKWKWSSRGSQQRIGDVFTKSKMFCPETEDKMPWSSELFNRREWRLYRSLW